MEHAREDVQRVLRLPDLLQDGSQVAARGLSCRAIQATGQTPAARRCASTGGGATRKGDTGDIDKALTHGSSREAESAGTVPANNQVAGGKAFDQVVLQRLASQTTNVVSHVSMH